MELRVKEIIKDKGRRINEVAQAMGVASESLNRIVNGVNTNPKIDTLQQIANALEVDVTELFSPKGDGFMAVVDHGGKLHRFDSIEALKLFLSEVENKD